MEMEAALAPVNWNSDCSCSHSVVLPQPCRVGRWVGTVAKSCSRTSALSAASASPLRNVHQTLDGGPEPSTQPSCSPHLRRRDAQHEGAAGAGLRAVLPQLRLAPEEDGQVVLEDAAPARRAATQWW